MVRILAPDPQSGFVVQQDKDENQQSGHTADTIEKLSEEIDAMNKRLSTSKSKGEIELRFYPFRPQDFYFRQDSFVYTGPYLYGVDSQQTVSFEYEGPSRGFDLYAAHFDRLWDAAQEKRKAVKRRRHGGQ